MVAIVVIDWYLRDGFRKKGLGGRTAGKQDRDKTNERDRAGRASESRTGEYYCK